MLDRSFVWEESRKSQKRIASLLVPTVRIIDEEELQKELDISNKLYQTVKSIHEKGNNSTYALSFHEEMRGRRGFRIVIM